MDYDFGFASALAVRLVDGASPDEASQQIQGLLDAEISSDEIRIGVGYPLVGLNPIYMLVPLQFRTQRAYRFSEAVDAAASTIAHIGSNTGQLASISEVRADDTPAIASSGMMS